MIVPSLSKLFLSLGLAALCVAKSRFSILSLACLVSLGCKQAKLEHQVDSSVHFDYVWFVESIKKRKRMFDNLIFSYLVLL